MFEELPDLDAPSSCNHYLGPMAIDLAVCFLGVVGIASGNQSLMLLAVLVIYAYGVWVYFRSNFAKGVYRLFKGRGPLASILMFLFLGLLAPIIHLVFTTTAYATCPESIPARLFPKLVSSIPATSHGFSPWRSLFAGVWGWLLVLIVFSVAYTLLMQVPEVIYLIADAVEAGEPDDLIGSIIYLIIAIPIYVVLWLVELFLNFAWNVISILLALLITFFVCKAILMWLSSSIWPKTNWIAVGSLITVSLSVLVYLVPVQSLFEPYVVSSDSILQKLTSLPFIVTGIVLATLSIPFLMRWARLSSDDIFP